MHADFPVVLDACVLANPGVCDLFLRLAEPPRLYLPRWSRKIFDEVHRVQTTKLPKPFPPELADHWRREVTKHFPEAFIEGYEPIEPQMGNHEKDRHVLAAAVHGHAFLIVTFNLRDFPLDAISRWNVEAKHPQDYLLTLYSMSPTIVVAKLAAIALDRGIDIQEVVFSNPAPATNLDGERPFLANPLS
ncbi:MAG TPA: PIN domain-containing protein [Candidatus Acidoferrum sp.]|nr:PIN domain-containing protein [Candidatus Acidoferrum sp.]